MTSSSLRGRKRGVKSAFFCIFALFLLALFLRNPRVASEAVIDALKKCAGLLIPSLFPLMVVAEIAVESGAIERLTKPVSSVVAKILGIKKEAVAPLFLGLVGGYTTSVGGALSLLGSDKISKSDCERIIALSSLPSLSFLTGFVGLGVLKNSTDGWILWGVAVFSALILGFFTRKSTQKADATLIKTESKSSASPSKIIVGAISHSAYSMLLICACVIFFSALIAALSFPLDTLGIPKNAQKIILGALEITSGTLACADIPSHSLRACACGAMIGWSGLSVHFQIVALCDGYGLSFKKYFLLKAIQGLLCATISFLIFKN